MNIPYTRAWVDERDKRLRDQTGLEQLYAGVDPATTLVIYCNSGRRGSFGYFTARLAGFERVMLYEASWKQWGLPREHYPVETEVNRLDGSAPALGGGSGGSTAMDGGKQRSSDTQKPGGSGGGQEPGGGYVSCGG